jgi:hypothetical protein
MGKMRVISLVDKNKMSKSTMHNLPNSISVTLGDIEAPLDSFRDRVSTLHAAVTRYIHRESCPRAPPTVTVAIRLFVSGGTLTVCFHFSASLHQLYPRKLVSSSTTHNCKQVGPGTRQSSTFQQGKYARSFSFWSILLLPSRLRPEAN